MDLKEKLSEVAEQKAKVDERFRKSKPPALPKIDEEQREQTFAAAMRLRDKRARELSDSHSKSTLVRNTVGYVECSVCSGPAIWVHGDPDAELSGGDWETAYKPKGVPWPGGHPHCQCCAGDGRKTPARVFTSGSRIAVNKRFWRELSREEFTQLTSGS